MLVGAGDLELRDPFEGLHHRPAHLVDGLLQRERVHLREGVEHDRADPVVGRVPVLRVGLPAPPRGDLGRQDAVGRLGEGGVAVAREAVELRPGRLEHHQVAQPGQHERPFLEAVDHRRPRLLPAPGERELVRRDAVPGVRLRLHHRPGDPRLGRPVGGQVEQERLRRGDAELLGLRVDHVLLGVGGVHVHVVALGEGGREVAPELGGHVQVVEGVPGAVPVDLDQAYLRLAVLVGAKSDRHQLPR